MMSSKNTGTGTVVSMKKIGKIVGFHGLQGDAKIRPTSGDPQWPGHIETIIIKPVAKAATGKQANATSSEKPAAKILPEKTLTLISAALKDRLVICRFKDHPDRTSIEPYLGAEVWADISQMPPLDEDEFWADDLIGLSVLDHKTRTRLGKVHDLVTSGGQDYLEIIHELTSDKVLIPLNEHFVPEINVAEGLLTLANLDGFFEGDEAE